MKIKIKTTRTDIMSYEIQITELSEISPDTVLPNADEIKRLLLTEFGTIVYRFNELEMTYNPSTEFIRIEATDRWTTITIEKMIGDEKCGVTTVIRYSGKTQAANLVVDKNHLENAIKVLSDAVHYRLIVNQISDLI